MTPLWPVLRRHPNSLLGRSSNTAKEAHEKDGHFTIRRPSASIPSDVCADKNRSEILWCSRSEIRRSGSGVRIMVARQKAQSSVAPARHHITGKASQPTETAAPALAQGRAGDSHANLRCGPVGIARPVSASPSRAESADGWARIRFPSGNRHHRPGRSFRPRFPDRWWRRGARGVRAFIVDLQMVGVHQWARNWDQT